MEELTRIIQGVLTTTPNVVKIEITTTKEDLESLSEKFNSFDEGYFQINNTQPLGAKKPYIRSYKSPISTITLNYNICN